MKKIFIFILILISATISRSQNLDWAIGFGGSAWEYPFSTAMDDTGNIYITGYFYNTVDFDPGSATYNLTVYGMADLFIAKYAPDGSFRWARQVGGKGNDIGTCITVDHLGFVYLSGLFSDTTDFNTGPGTYNLVSLGDYDAFVMKMDNNGDMIWVTRFGNTFADRANSVTVDNTGNVYVCGEYSTTGIIRNIFFAKCFSNGNLSFLNYINGTFVGSPADISLDKYGNLVLTGSISGTFDFDPGPGTYNLSNYLSNDIFLVKYNPLGNLKWAYVTGKAQSDFAERLLIDDSLNIYIAGFFGDTVDFDFGAGMHLLQGQGMRDIFFAKYDSSGNYIWAKSIGSAQEDVCVDLAADTSGNIFLTGYISGTVDFDPGPGAANLTMFGTGTNAYFAMYDCNGNYLMARNLGNGGLWVAGTAVALDKKKNLFVSGYFDNTVDFDPGTGTYNLTSVGGADNFIAKYSLCNMSMNSNHVDVSCFGLADGSIAVSVLNGNPPYYYNWSNGDNSPVADSLSEGNYYISLADHFDCLLSDTFHISQPYELFIGYISYPASCGACPDGFIDLTVMGGTQPYTYNWSNSSSNEDLTGLTWGYYDVTVTDTNGCIASETIFVDFTWSTQSLTGSGTAVLISPNPTNGLLEISNAENCIVEVLDVPGETIIKTTITASSAWIDLSSLAAGCYLIKYTSAQRCGIARVVLRK